MSLAEKSIESEANLTQKLKSKNINLVKKVNQTSKVEHFTVWPILQIISYVVVLAINIFIPEEQSVNVKPYRICLSILIAFFIANYILSFFNKNIKKKVYYKAEFYFAVSIILDIWDILTEKLNVLPLPFFPSIAQIFQSIVEDYQTLIISTAYSLRLLVLGFAIGAIIGVITGVLIGWYQQWYYWLFPLIKAIGIIPATAWIPIAMFIFPSSFSAEVFLIVLCVWFPVALMTSSGMGNINKSYFEAARTLGANETFLIFKIAVPGAMPYIFSGIYTGISIAFATLIVSEMIGAKAGLGWYINWAKGWSNYAKVYASLIIMAIVFSIIMAILFKIRDRVLIWQKGLLK